MKQVTFREFTQICGISAYNNIIDGCFSVYEFTVRKENSKISLFEFFMGNDMN